MTTPSTIDRFYPIVPDIIWLKRILPLGVKTVQLRIKDESDENIRHQIKEAIDITRNTDCQLIINDFWEIAIELRADYIHLGQEDLAAADLAAIKNAGLKLGLSSHDKKELQTAIDAGPDYIALGPIFETKLKKMKWRPQGLERLTNWKSAIKTANKSQTNYSPEHIQKKWEPVFRSEYATNKVTLIAIGGLTVENAANVIKAGADSLAVVTDFITHSEPETRIKQWLSVTRQ